jgi:hypothetical protein
VFAIVEDAIVAVVLAGKFGRIGEEVVLVGRELEGSGMDG